MILLEYDKSVFRLVKVGLGEIYRSSYKKLYHEDGFYHFHADNGNCCHIPESQVIVKELRNNNWLPRV